MKLFRILILSAGLLLAALSGCSETQPEEISQPEQPTNTQETPETPPAGTGTQQSPIPEQTPEGTSSAAPQELIEKAKADLARFLNIEADQISVVEILATVWRDASLGCPKPGIDYIRVETPGYRIVLQAGGQVYNYHSDEARRVIRCNQ